MEHWKERLAPLQMECLAPQEIEAALAKRSLVYIPLGALEYHGPHLPIGLDGMTAHGVSLHSCEVTGGLVMPPLYYGMTGSIGHHPWTILIENEATLKNILLDTLHRLEDFEVSKVVIFTGHFGRRQLALLNELQLEWNSPDRSLSLICASISDLPDVTMKGDHAAIFETSVLARLRPDLVHIDRLPNIEKFPANDPEGDSWGNHRRNVDNVLFGILGDDPRNYDEEQAKGLFNTIVSGLVYVVGA